MFQSSRNEFRLATIRERSGKFLAKRMVREVYSSMSNFQPPSEKQTVANLFAAIGGTQMAITTAKAPDADHTTVLYPVAAGVKLRRKFGLTGKQMRISLTSGLGVAYLGVGFLLVVFVDYSTPYRELIWWIFGFIGWLLCCIATILSPDDLIYLDRLTCIIPTRNPLSSRKLLWSKLEEISIVDCIPKSGAAADDKPSQFALRLLETSGFENFIYLNVLQKQSLDTLVDYIRRYASHTRGIAQLNEIDRFLEYQQGNIAKISYTQLWESSCSAQFGLTSFTPLAPGTKIQSSYTVKKQIAAGGFSAIYLIEDELKAQYVLKESVLPPGMDETAKAKATEHFQREAKILAKVDHSQIARVYDHFVENGRSYLRMEYIEGTSLRAHVRDNGVQDELVVKTWLSQLQKILTYLHGMSPPVVHRDLTPDNVMLRPDGSIALIDFGAANEFIGSATGTLIGKHAYMAPEQIQGCAEPASDIYSLGALGYYCVCGRDPEPIRTASPLRDGAKVTAEFDEYIQSCMNLNREARMCVEVH
jgi:tRNA A-37 threonylcarbamoyl transferase component Bud32